MKKYMPTAEHKTGLVLFPAFDWCISPTHPEREERLLYTKDQLIEEGLEDVGNIFFFNPELADYHDIDRVHFCVPSSQKLLTESHLISTGGAIRAAKAVMEKEVEKAFAVVRPPGHHAMQTVFGDRGFCIVNIEAIMVEYLRRHYGVRKVAIVDTDLPSRRRHPGYLLQRPGYALYLHPPGRPYPLPGQRLPAGIRRAVSTWLYH